MTTVPTKIDKALLANRFGSRVETYDQVTPVQASMAKYLLERAVNHFKTRQPKRILELGCGTGRMTQGLIAAFPEAEITAVDISAQMIERARTRNPEGHFQVADAETFLQDYSDSFDLIISNAVIQWFENVDTALKCAYGKLTSQGLMLVSTFGDQTFTELNQAFRHAYAVTGQKRMVHTVPMRHADEWRQSFPQATVSQQLQIRSFVDVRTFLSSVQQAGAVNSLSGPHFLSRQVLHEMMQFYTCHFSDLLTGNVMATYHMVYLQLVKRQ
jgi:malonyl-CoA O-methyltransferase